MNIVQPVLYFCKATPTEPALIVPGTSLHVMSYAGLERSMNSVGRKALALGLKRGSVVALFIEDSMLHAIMILALTRLGIITVSAFNPSVPEGLEIDAFFTNEDFSFHIEKKVRVDPGWATGNGEPIEDIHLSNAHPDDLCRIILTSGTTGEPKAVAVTHRMLRRRIARHQYILGNRFPYCSRICISLGLPTSLGFQVLLSTLWRGGTALMPGPNPPATLNGIELCRIQAIVGSPRALFTFAQAYEARSPAQPRLEAIFSGGSTLPPALAERVQRAMCSHLLNFYGSTETSMVAAAPMLVLANTPGAAGYVLPGITVEIVDRSGIPLAANIEGTVRIHGNYSVSGYLGKPEQSSRAFRDNWFYPGDAGYLTPDKLLVITGRENTVINLSGDKVRPERIEEILVAHSTVEQAAVFTVAAPSGLPELWAAVVPRGSTDLNMLRAYCQTKLPPVFVPVNFIIVAELPRNAMGKVERLRLPELAKRRLN